MKAGEIAWTDFRPIGPDDSLASVEDRLIREKFLVVERAGAYLGLLTVTDIVAKRRILAIDCMSSKPEIEYNEPLETALQKMELENVLFLPVFQSGAFYGVVSYRGIAHKLREQRKMLQKREALNVNKIEQFDALRSLAGGVAHDFNNLLAAILGSIDVVCLETTLSEENREHLETASKAAVSATELAAQLISFSRNGVLLKEQVDIAAFIDENARFIARGYNLAIKVDFVRDAEGVFVNRAQFGRVVNNLVLNAAQAMEAQGGALRISGALVRLTELSEIPIQSGTYLCITFEDNGPGIDPAHLPYVFDPYFTTKHGGNGLGLAIAYSIVSDHGGCMTVDSVKDSGTTFKIYLPSTLSNPI